MTMLDLVVAAGAGIATVASPCVLPMLPLLLGGSLQPGDRLRPLCIVGGFVLSFAASALLVGRLTQALGLPPDAVRQGAIGVLLLFGLLMLWPALYERVMAPLGRVANSAAQLGQRTGRGRLGGFALGLTLGALWTPCAGPVLASTLALVATVQAPAHAAALLLAFALGAGLPMLAIAHGGQAVGTRLRAFSRHGRAIRQGFGVLVVGLALAMQWQLDTAITAWLPSAQAAPAAPPAAQTAPEFTGIHQWLNSPPLTMAGLRGQVVLVDFWTFGCSNCVHTLPQLAALHQRYKDQGLVIVGVHTPEFAFEQSTDAVRQAIQRHQLAYPVAQDNGYRTWKAWGNRYWPAQYLVDRQGRVVFVHEGEGDEAVIEQRIRQLLAEGPSGRDR
jgi:cytochrome c biogenesis protein CcdA/thiol-disulfide isomerase/thioredoxin